MIRRVVLTHVHRIVALKRHVVLLQRRQLGSLVTRVIAHLIFVGERVVVGDGQLSLGCRRHGVLAQVRGRFREKVLLAV